jgi:hypothetical protein
MYEQAGIAHYWLADPAVPSLSIRELIDGRYEQTHVAGHGEAISLSRPFALELVPQGLARG